MCLYWKKKHLCGCDSHLFRDRCPSALSLSTPYCSHEEFEPTPRKSYFKCYDCLKKEDWEEKQEVLLAAQKAAEQRAKDEEKARAELARKDAAARAERERVEDARRDRERKLEIERQRREGGAWTDAVAGRKKGKGKRTIAGLLHPPVSAPAAIETFKARADMEIGGVFAPLTIRENGTTAAATAEMNGAAGGAKNGVGVGVGAGKDGAGAGAGVGKDNGVVDKGVDPGGRAGRWGPKSPPKMILKPENPGWKKM